MATVIPRAPGKVEPFGPAAAKPATARGQEPGGGDVWPSPSRAQPTPYDTIRPHPSPSAPLPPPTVTSRPSSGVLPRAESHTGMVAREESLWAVEGQSEPSASVLVGIARLAAAAPREAEKRQVEYYRLPVRSILNRVTSERVGFVWSINPYRGCEFGCQYCYARYTHEYMELAPTEFERKIYVKDNAARRLLADLSPEKVIGQHIAIGTATDPYQPAERMFGVTREILETLLAWSEQLRTACPAGERGAGLSLSITTKSDLILRDTELLRRLSARNRFNVNFSITTLNARLARALEPRAPTPQLRLEAVEKLNQAGVIAGVFLAPVLPGITDKPEDLEAVVAAAARAGARYLSGHVVFLMPSSQKTFFPFLQQKFPRLVKQYRKWFLRTGYAPEAYRARIRELLADLRRKHNLPAGPPHEGFYAVAVAAAPAPQLALPFVS